MRSAAFEEIARVLFVDDDTIRSWFRLMRKMGSMGWRGLAMRAPPANPDARNK
jgi:hypothetical protein